MRRNLLCRLTLLALVSISFASTETVAQTGQPAVGQNSARQAQVTPVPTLGAPLAQITPTGQQSGQAGLGTQQRLPMGLPFQLTAVEKQFVDQILLMWENESAKIKTFNSRFELWEFNQTFGPGGDIPFIKSIGQLSYSKPDKGSFKIGEVYRYQPKDPKSKPKPEDWVRDKEAVGAHWVCDGKAYFEYKHRAKQLVVTPLPPHLQGEAIVNGPLPFLFGAKADDLNRRYWIRSKQSDPATIWLEAYPRTQADAVNYHHVEIMLDRKTMQPKAIQVHTPNNKDRKMYMFDKPTVNGRMDALFGSLFSAPRTPFGWKRVVQELPGAPQQTLPQATNPQPKLR